MESRDRLKAGSTMNQIWLHILNPTDADKGKYVLELFDGNDTHKLSTDLSGQGKLSQQHGHGNQISLSCSPGFLQTIGSNSSLLCLSWRFGSMTTCDETGFRKTMNCP